MTQATTPVLVKNETAPLAPTKAPAVPRRPVGGYGSAPKRSLGSSSNVAEDFEAVITGVTKFPRIEECDISEDSPDKTASKTPPMAPRYSICC